MGVTTEIDPVELTKSLIACPSITPEDAGVLGQLQKELERIGLNAKDINLQMKIRLTLTTYLQNMEMGDPIFVLVDTRMLCLLEI